jgi:hypothetical protein
MNTNKRWTTLLALTLSAAIVGAFASTIRRRRARVAHHEQHQANLKDWENEGGNVAPTANPAPIAVTATQP